MKPGSVFDPTEGRPVSASPRLVQRDGRLTKIKSLFRHIQTFLEPEENSPSFSSSLVVRLAVRFVSPICSSALLSSLRFVFLLFYLASTSFSWLLQGFLLFCLLYFVCSSNGRVRFLICDLMLVLLISCLCLFFFFFGYVQKKPDLVEIFAFPMYFCGNVCWKG